MVKMEKLSMVEQLARKTILFSIDYLKNVYLVGKHNKILKECLKSKEERYWWTFLIQKNQK